MRSKVAVSNDVLSWATRSAETVGSEADGLKASDHVGRKERWRGDLAKSPNCRNPESAWLATLSGL
jgi:hypothetical protein